jgi:hypothetical protein
MTQRAESAEEHQRLRRAMIRAHHPDRGGDPAEFVFMMQRLDKEALSLSENGEMRFGHRRRWWQEAGTFRLFRRTEPRLKRVT